MKMYIFMLSKVMVIFKVKVIFVILGKLNNIMIPYFKCNIKYILLIICNIVPSLGECIFRKFFYKNDDFECTYFLFSVLVILIFCDILCTVLFKVNMK